MIASTFTTIFSFRPTLLCIISSDGCMYGPTQKIQPCARASMHVCVHTAKCVASKEGPVCTKAAELSKTTGLRNTVVATMWQIQGRDTTHACVGGGLQSCTHDSLRSARGDIPPPERAVTHYARTAVCTRFVYVCVCVQLICHGLNQQEVSRGREKY